MSVAGLVTALAVGVVVGLLGGLVRPHRREPPLWLTVAIGVVAALVGTISAALVGVDTGTFDPLVLVALAGFAGLCVALAAATGDHRRSGST